MAQPSFKTNVVTGSALLALSENVRGWQKRDCYRQLERYLHSAECDRVCVLFGLRRTGKTTLLRQAVLDMTPEDAAKTAYIKAMKIVLPSTDSLGFWPVLHQKLYDRAKMIHPTFIPYREHSHLLGVDQIDEYIPMTVPSGSENWLLK